MYKLIFYINLFCITFANGQKIPNYRYINICKQDGMSETINFKKVGERKYISIMKDFEKKLSKNNYSDYYRLYSPHFNKQIDPTYLYVYLIPKKLIQQDIKKEIVLFPTKEALEIIYDLSTKKISQPKPSIILPDL